MKLTPMLEQYLRIKAEHRDAILLFRLGDFYEMFFEDAQIAAGILDITLTSRNRGDGADAIPLCGVPYHAVEPYIAKLLGAGWKVAICEQREEKGGALMAREVVRVVTAGSVLDGASLDPARPNFLAAIAREGARCGLAIVEFSTGGLRATETGSWAAVIAELERLEVREVVVPPTLSAEEREVLAAGRWAVSTHADAAGEIPGDSEWARTWPCAGQALRNALGYLAYAHRGALGHLRPCEPYELNQYLQIDASSRRNLELLTTLSGERRGALLWVLDDTMTPMGARTLREWVLSPLLGIETIGGRLDAVEELVDSVAARVGLRDALAGTGDLERLAGRLGAGTASPRDLSAIAAALDRVAALRERIAGVQAPRLRLLGEGLKPLPEVRTHIVAALVDAPPAHARAGGIIRAGFHGDVDELRRFGQDGRGGIARLEAGERGRTGIASLKVRYNKVFGYYIEVSKPNLHLVPADYQRKQTLVGAERFVTPQLKEYETRVLGADERLRELESALFEALLAEVASAEAQLGATARAIGEIDALASLAEVAHRRGYVRPAVVRDTGIAIEGGRHPVVEALLTDGGAFVPNDCHLDAEHGHMVILTGPNMAGKSTYLRQTALIVLMAQMGSFVPAAAARLGTVDRIFTRVGAADNLAAGDSTFMVEMRETANILSGVTPRSLVILDEIGRGTSTFDGISIAWAVVEHLYHHAGAPPLTVFATHYHELTEVAEICPGVRNASVAVREWKGDVVFLRRVVPGPASRSYGIEVARLAGVPESVVQRAKEILVGLEDGAGPARAPAGRPRSAPAVAPAQGSLFESPLVRLQREIAGLEVERLTPLDALNYLERLVRAVRSAS
jgi:DNA mismatch repair protein MutS